ncbi:hypothetical protein [Streptomyces sp. NBC_00328]|uniref:hypothetical protein n=1 Tax=Streptomyces sp. NBC_00328 TaxID=2903646 RepID=UPI002E2B1203|nr:hypothetical protein [Streptomyces sp. NBC_00328]
MLTAEASNLVGYASGFPVRGDDSGGPGFGRALPIVVGRLTSAGRALTLAVAVAVAFAFAFAGILVRPQARGRDEARRPQERDGRGAADGAVLLTPVLPLGVRTALRLEGLDHRSWTRW